MENNNNMTQPTAGIQKTGKSRRGFASMDKERHKLVSSKGGKAIRATVAGRSGVQPGEPQLPG